MKNKKGFTLIELLAVIVILAVIMVIAVPQILKVIDNSKSSAAESSIKLVKDSIKTQVATAMMSEVNFEKNENGCYIFDFENNNINVQNLSLKNKDKIGGKIEYCDGKLEKDTLIFKETSESNGNNNNNESKVKICQRATSLHTERCTSTHETYYCSGAGYTERVNGSRTITYGNLGTEGREPESGDAFDCDVDGNGTYDEDERFYYVTDLEENSKVAVLVYYNNVSNGVASNSTTYAYANKEDYISAGGEESDYGSYGNWNKGPVTAIKQLPKTSVWNKVNLNNAVRNIKDQLNVEKISNFSYSGYAARLLTTQEVNRACNVNIENNSRGALDNCIYLLENTIFEPEDVGNYGYWLENVYSNTSSDAWYINATERTVDMGNGIQIINNNTYGIRPVIEVLKTNIKY